MSGRSHIPQNAARGPFGPGGHFVPGMRPMGPPLDMLPPHMVLEENLAAQHEGMQRILTENQRLAATHVALRQELAAAQQELQWMKQALNGFEAERDQHLRALTEKLGKMEGELRGVESLKGELQKAQMDAQKLLSIREELGLQAQQLSQELHMARTEAQQAPAIKTEIEALRQEVTRARGAFDFEKKANADLLDQRQAMEKNLVLMAREIEKLRAEFTNAEKKSLGGPYGGGAGYGGHDSRFSSNAYPEKYGTTQMPTPPENNTPFGSQSGAPAWGAYGGGGPLNRR